MATTMFPCSMLMLPCRYRVYNDLVLKGGEPLNHKLSHNKIPFKILLPKNECVPKLANFQHSMIVGGVFLHAVHMFFSICVVWLPAGGHSYYIIWSKSLMKISYSLPGFPWTWRTKTIQTIKDFQVFAVSSSHFCWGKKSAKSNLSILRLWCCKSAKGFFGG